MEGIGLIIGLHLLYGLSCQLTHVTVLGTNNQAVIKALRNQKSHAVHYILDTIHSSAEKLNAKQDWLINWDDRTQAIEAGDELVGRKCGVIDLQIHWILNHHLFCIHQLETPSCPHCHGITVETIKHFLLDCPHYVQEHHELCTKLCQNSDSLSFLLSNHEAASLY